jgi:hypothetical protein
MESRHLTLKPVQWLSGRLPNRAQARLHARALRAAKRPPTEPTEKCTRQPGSTSLCCRASRTQGQPRSAAGTTATARRAATGGAAQGRRRAGSGGGARSAVSAERNADGGEGPP